MFFVFSSVCWEGTKRWLHSTPSQVFLHPTHIKRFLPVRWADSRTEHHFLSPCCCLAGYHEDYFILHTQLLVKLLSAVSPSVSDYRKCLSVCCWACCPGDELLRASCLWVWNNSALILSEHHLSCKSLIFSDLLSNHLMNHTCCEGGKRVRKIRENKSR